MENQPKLSPQQQKELEEVQSRIAFQNKFIEQLSANESVQAYFGRFNPGSVQDFIRSYSYQKARWHQSGEFYRSQKEQHELKWIEDAWWHLEAIQQKKLFDAQCRWRAEELALPEVSLCCDFGYWEYNVLNCPFVEPITRDEVDMYQEYLRSDDAVLKDELPLFFYFQHYETIKQGYEAEDGEAYFFPEWYAFYNARKGTQYLMALPDIRGAKESFYIRLGRSTQPGKSAAFAEMKAVLTNPDPGSWTDREQRPFLNAFDEDTLREFVDAFEDKQTKEYFEAASWFNGNSEEREEMMAAIDLFLYDNEPVPMEAAADWKEAIRNAVRQYTVNKIAEHLDEAFEQYRLSLSMNISFPERKADSVLAAKKDLTADILLGRKLSGEPEDLDF